MRKSTIIVIICMVIAGLALAYGMYLVDLAAHPNSAPVPVQPTPARGDKSPTASGETESDDPAKGEGKGSAASSDKTESDVPTKGEGGGNAGLNEVPVTKDPATDPLPNSNSGSDSGSNSDKPFGGGMPGFSADEIIRNPLDSGGEQPNATPPPLPDGIDPDDHIGSF